MQAMILSGRNFILEKPPRHRPINITDSRVKNSVLKAQALRTRRRADSRSSIAIVT